MVDFFVISFMVVISIIVTGYVISYETDLVTKFLSVIITLSFFAYYFFFRDNPFTFGDAFAIYFAASLSVGLSLLQYSPDEYIKINIGITIVSFVIMIYSFFLGRKIPIISYVPFFDSLFSLLSVIFAPAFLSLSIRGIILIKTKFDIPTLEQEINSLEERINNFASIANHNSPIMQYYCQYIDIAQDQLLQKEKRNSELEDQLEKQQETNKTVNLEFEYEEQSEQSTESNFSYRDKEKYYEEILGIDGYYDALELKKKYFEKVKEYHPDKVASLGEALRQVAHDEMQKINAAYEFLKQKFENEVKD